MRWRRMFGRILVLLLAVAAGGGYWVYQRLTDPAAVRAKVLEELAKRFPGAEVEIGSAQLRLFGGVHLRDLTLTRKDSPKGEPFATIPEIVLHPDKQQLGRGNLVIRKIELKNPTLNVIRKIDGSFNLAGIATAAKDDGPTPIIEIHQATMHIVDESDTQGEIKLTRLDMTVSPIDAHRLTFHVAGQIESLGGFELDGTVDPKTGDTTINGKLPEFAVNAALLHRMATYLPEAKEYAEVIQGTGSLTGDVAYHPGAAKPLSYSMRFGLKNGRIEHPSLAFALEKAEMAVHCDGGRVVLEKLTGQAGGATVQVAAELDALALDADFRARLYVHRFPVTKELYEKASPPMRELCDDYQPEGDLTIDAEVHRRRGELSIRYTLTPENLSIRFIDFPYPLKRITGSLSYTEDNNDPRLRINLAGEASGQPVRIVGEAFGEGLRPGIDLKAGFHLTITASEIPIDATAFDALKPYPEVKRSLDELHLTGKVNVRAESRCEAGKPLQLPPKPNHRIAVTVRNGTMNYDRFPYPLEEINGTVEIQLPEESWHFKDIRAKHKGGLFAAAGASRPTPEGDHIRLAIRGVNAQLDDEMEFALGPRMKEAWDLFCPEGRVDFVTRVELLGKDCEPKVDLDLTARRLKMKPPCFPFELTEVNGAFRYAKDVVTLNRFEARHGECKLSLGGDAKDESAGGRVVVRPGGGFRAELRQIRAEPLTVDKDFLAALPRRVREVFQTLRPDQPIRLVTDLVIDDPGDQGPTLYEWDGHVAFSQTNLYCGVELGGVTGLVALRGSYDGKKLAAAGNIQLEEVTLAKLPLQQVRGKLEIVNDKIALKGLVAELHGGEVYGKVVANFEPELTYSVDLTASKIDMAKYARKGLGRRGQVQGLLFGRLSLTGKGADRGTLRGNGEFSIPDGKLYDLPLIVEVLTFLSGYLPKGAAFQEVDAKFAIAGDQVTFSQLTLLGEAISLRGKGTVKTDGSDLDLEMYGLVWGRAMPLLPPVIDAIPPAISKSLMQIKVQGSVDKAKPKIEPVPVLVEPVKDLLQFLSRRQKQ